MARATNLGATRLRRRKRSQDAMRAFDALPPPLRRWLAEAALPWSPASCRRIWMRARSEGEPVEAVLARLDRAQQACLGRDICAGLGWQKRGEGRLMRDGEHIAFTPASYPDRPELRPVAALPEQRFRAAGVNPAIDTTRSSEMPAGHRGGSLGHGRIARTLSPVPDPIGTVLSDHHRQGKESS